VLTSGLHAALHRFVCAQAKAMLYRAELANSGSHGKHISDRIAAESKDRLKAKAKWTFSPAAAQGRKKNYNGQH
jgi:hypothetical protein